MYNGLFAIWALVKKEDFLRKTNPWTSELHASQAF